LFKQHRVRPKRIISVDREDVTRTLLARGLGVGLLSSAIPYALEIEALRRLPNAVFGVMMSLEPAVAALIGFIALGQGLHWTEAVAIGLVVAASAGALRSAATPAPRDG
jgi:inner membrane transporter RhtA